MNSGGGFCLESRLGFMYVIDEAHIAIMIDWEQIISDISRGKPNR